MGLMSMPEKKPQNDLPTYLHAAYTQTDGTMYTCTHVHKYTCTYMYMHVNACTIAYMGHTSVDLSFFGKWLLGGFR